MKVLALFSQPALQRRVAEALTAHEGIVEMATSAKDCLARFTLFEAVLIEAGPDDFAYVRALVMLLRKERSDTSIFVFERGLDLEERIGLLEAGVDYCVPERFFSSEFAVRLGLSIRRRQAASGSAAPSSVNILRSGDLEMDLGRRRVTRLGKVIALRSKEFLLLEYLVRNVDRTVTREMIIEHIWHSSFEGLNKVVDVLICSLRKKLDEGFSLKLIRANRGIGYTFSCAVAAQSPATLAQRGRTLLRVEAPGGKT
jgi:two-component system, OmpR family, response regulator